MNAERLLRRIRACDAMYGSRGLEKELQAERIRDACIRKLSPTWRERAAQVDHARGQRMLGTWD